VEARAGKGTGDPLQLSEGSIAAFVAQAIEMVRKESVVVRVLVWGVTNAAIGWRDRLHGVHLSALPNDIVVQNQRRAMS
jgi:hypothetical protein